MIWTSKAIFFPLRFFVQSEDGFWSFAEELLAEFFTRYLIETGAEEQTIDGVVVTLSPVEQETLLATIARDNHPLTRFHKASLKDGTLPLRPVYDPPATEDELTEDHVLLGFALSCCWPETFLADLARSPQPEPELFDGIQIL